MSPDETHQNDQHSISRFSMHGGFEALLALIIVDLVLVRSYEVQGLVFSALLLTALVGVTRSRRRRRGAPPAP